MTTPTATGGFVSRSERTSGSPLRTATGPVGPGAYDLDQPRQVAPAPVPFQTSKERNLLENMTTSAITPGVGFYDAATAHDLSQAKRTAPAGPTASFAAGVPRLEKTTRSNVPGPGTYVEPNGWIKKSPHFKAPAPAQRVLFVRVPSAPSIPATHQTFGYEEGEGGVLVMQRPTDPIHTGRDGDTVGPGSYDPAADGVRRQKATAWGNSKTRRGLEFKSISPGPGAYNPNKGSGRSHSSPIVVSINGVDVQFGGAAGTAQFVSKVPLWSQQQVPEHQRTPGPGAYEAPGIASKAQPLPEELQCFSSTAKRGSAVDPMKSLAAPSYFRAPGPGAYEDPRRSISVNVPQYVDPQPFNTTGQRFAKPDNGLPGPGDYASDHVLSLAKAAQDKAAVSRSGVFGTMAPRFPSRAELEAAALPAPGSYQPREASPPRHRGDGAVFQSKTPRFRAMSAPVAALQVRHNTIVGRDDPAYGDPSNLGPGSYSSPDAWSGPRRHPGFKSTAFGSETRRSTGSAATLTPGPGRYKQDVDINKAFRPYANPSKETVFGSQTSRFKQSASYTPGPGHYTGVQPDLVRKSYNITYTGTAPEATRA